MTDHTVVEHISPIKLIARLDQSTDPNAREAGRRLAEALERPYRTVGAALMPRKRGGVTDWQAEQLAERNEAYRDFVVAEYGTQFLTPKQARAAIKKVKKLMAEACRMEGGGSVQQDAIARIRAAGAEIVGDKQLRRILVALPKK